MLEVPCAPWYQTKIYLQIVSKDFLLSLQNIHYKKKTKSTKDIGYFASLKSSKAINGFCFLWSSSNTDLFFLARLFWQKFKYLNLKS